MSVVYITGASAGLGRAVAHGFAKAGYQVGLIARDEPALAATAATLGVCAAYAPADVADFTALKEAARRLEQAIGPPDLWINNAMATIFSRFEDIAPEEFARAVSVTLMGSIYGLHLAHASMKPRGRGHIIQIGSALSYRAIPLQAPYCAAKYGIRGAVDSFRCELLNEKSPVRLTMVHMPAMNTPQFDWARRHIAELPQPVPPIYAPEACANAVLWAARHPKRREVLVGAPTLQAVIGNKIAPALLDFYLARRGLSSQYEKPAGDRDDNGNLFAPVPAFHAVEGRFAARQKSHILWIGTSATQEIILLMAILFLFCFIIGRILFS